MSFILDALRKSEHDRQRQTGPALAEIPVSASSPRSNVWAPVVIALLLINLVVVGVLLVRKAAREPAAAPAAAAAAAPTAPAASAASPASGSSAATAVTGPAAQTPGISVAPVLQPSTTAPQAVPPPASVASRTGVQARNPLEAEASGAPPMLDPSMAQSAAAAPPGPPAVTRTPNSRGSVVYESMPDSTAVGGPSGMSASSPAYPSQRAASAGSSLASADELVAAGIPTLNLDLHVFSTVPAERMIFVNSRKYREGDTMQEGPVVRQITPAGAILDYNGRAYLLTNK